MSDLLSVEVLVPLGLFTAIALMVIFLARYRHNQRIELIRQGINPFAQIPSAPGSKVLLWGLIFALGGIAFIVSYYIVGNEGTLQFGIIAFAVGIALLIYYKISAPDRERRMKLYEKQIEEVSSNNVVSQRDEKEKETQT